MKFVDGSIEADLPTKVLSEFFNVNCFIVSQTNPWVIPFMKHSEWETNSSTRALWRGIETLGAMFFAEVKLRIYQLGLLGVIPQKIFRFFNLVTQQYQGNVTIVPLPSIRDYFNIMKLFKNPEADELGCSFEVS